MSEHVKPWPSTFNRTGKMFTANMLASQRSVTNTVRRAVSEQNVDVRKGRDGVFWTWVTGGEASRVCGRIVAIDASFVGEGPAAEFGLVG